jgi:hypothetical protein
MSNAAAASNIVSLDEYRRSRGEKRAMSPRLPAVPMPVWVYWVPVWVW